MLFQTLLADHLLELKSVSEDHVTLSVKKLYEGEITTFLLYSPAGFVFPEKVKNSDYTFEVDFEGPFFPIVEGVNSFGKRMYRVAPQVLRVPLEKPEIRVISDIKNGEVLVYVFIQSPEGVVPVSLNLEGKRFRFFNLEGKWICVFKSFLEDGAHELEITFNGPYGYTFSLKKEIYVIKRVAVPMRGEDGAFDYTVFAEHVVKRGETLWSIANQYGVRVGDIVLINRLEDPDRIVAGQVLKIGRVYFRENPVTIVVNLFSSKLALYYDGVLLKVYPVALGRSDATPPGRYWVLRKEIDPALYWFGEYISPRTPLNGLGTRYMQLSDPTYAIHGTSKPWEIGKRISHGCIRMFNRDVEEIDAFAGVGTEVVVVKEDKEFPERIY
ncbi:L,D-transpeptidase family protein [Thermotoga sp. EMP]|uniref:L,D-transpeptidase family protein n=1 Tax=unclassified Thermotoga TaxID=2631113 RepID=UPI00056FE0AE|nr:L,D-transpeptidase family protein [Thermotoga sp. EMP]